MYLYIYVYSYYSKITILHQKKRRIKCFSHFHQSLPARSALSAAIALQLISSFISHLESALHEWSMMPNVFQLDIFDCQVTVNPWRGHFACHSSEQMKQEESCMSLLTSFYAVKWLAMPCISPSRPQILLSETRVNRIVVQQT